LTLFRIMGYKHVIILYQFIMLDFTSLTDLITLYNKILYLTVQFTCHKRTFHYFAIFLEILLDILFIMNLIG